MTKFIPSGRVAWRRFPFALLAGAAAALMLAHWAWLLDARGWRVPVLSAWLFGWLAGLAAIAAVRWGHCRHPWFGALAGVLLGWIAFFGMFEFALLANGLDPRALPSYIVLRMRHVPRDGARQPKPVAAPLDIPADGVSAREAWRWSAFGLEFLGATFLGGAMGGVAAMKGYSETRRRWMQGRAYHGPRGFGRSALGAVQGVDLPHGDLRGPAAVMAEFLPPLADATEIILTIRDWTQDYDPNPRFLIVGQRLNEAERARFRAWRARYG